MKNSLFLRIAHNLRSSTTKKMIAATCSLAIFATVGCSTASVVDSEPTKSTGEASALASPSVTTFDTPTPSKESSVANTKSSGGSFFSISGSADLISNNGYAVTLQLNWSGSEPRIDVGSNPPGKTNILMSAQVPSGTLTNTTVGGRGYPVSSLIQADLVALYPAQSAICTQLDSRGKPDDRLLTVGIALQAMHIRSAQFCGVRLIEATGIARGGGKLDIGSLPNGVPIDFTYNDFTSSAASAQVYKTGQYAQPVSTGPSWSGLDENVSVAIRDALAHPLAFGVDTAAAKPASEFCTYPSEVSATEFYIALLESNVGQTVPGC